MSPFAGYVWASYAVSLVTLVATVGVTLLSWRKAKRAIREIQDSETKF